MNTPGIVSHTLISSCCSVFHLIYCVLLVAVQGAPRRLCLIKSNNSPKACTPLEFSGRNQRFFKKLLQTWRKHSENVFKFTKTSLFYRYFIVIIINLLLIASAVLPPPAPERWSPSGVSPVSNCLQVYLKPLFLPACARLSVVRGSSLCPVCCLSVCFGLVLFYLGFLPDS